MPKKEEIIKLVHRALEYETRINLHRFPVTIGFTDGAVIREGEVERLAEKNSPSSMRRQLKACAA